MQLKFAPFFLLAVAPLAVADDVDSKPAPTAWACSPKTLASGQDCTFEVDAEIAPDRAAQLRINRQVVRDLVQTLCHEFPPSFRATCTAAVLKDSNEACEGQGPLVDDQKRFTLGGRGCYQALSHALAAMRVKATPPVPRESPVTDSVPLY